MKKIITSILIFMITLFITACDGNQSFEKRYLEDKSTLLTEIEVSGETFTMYLSNKLIPIHGDIYTLSMQAQQLKAGTGNVDTELDRIENILESITDTKEGISDMLVGEDRKGQQEDVLSSLNELEIQLISYQTLLSGEEDITKKEIQYAMDLIMASLESVKQYAK